MRHRKYTFKIGRTSEHRRSLMANAVCSLIKSGRITTTVAKAKEIRRLTEKMITLGLSGTLHDRRRAISILHQTDTVAELFSKVAPQYEGRHGGYTRTMRLGQRLGDAAEMCILELIPTTTTPAAAAEAAVSAEAKTAETATATDADTKA